MNTAALSRALPVFAFIVALATEVPPSRAAEPPLRPLPADKLAQMAPLLRHGEVALLESKPNGQMRQVTVMALVAAPPQVTRDVVTTPEKWPEFVPSLTRSRVTRHPDGSLDYDFAMDLKITSLATYNHMWPESDGSVDVKDNNPTDATRLEWQFYGVPRADGKQDTVMVQYGYTDILHANPWIQRIVRAAPLMEHGLALSAQLAYVRAMKARAEKIAGNGPAPHSGGQGPGFKFLLERGRVAVIRSTPQGRLSDISILDTFYAPISRVMEVIGNPRDYFRFIEGMKKSYEVKRDAGSIVFETELDLSLFSWSTRFGLHRSGPNSVDIVGESGDLHSSHQRWDLTSKGEKETLVVYRASQDLSAASPLILGTIFRTVPLFEHGIAVALGLVNVVGVRGRAEGWR